MPIDRVGGNKGCNKFKASRGFAFGTSSKGKNMGAVRMLVDIQIRECYNPLTGIRCEKEGPTSLVQDR